MHTLSGFHVCFTLARCVCALVFSVLAPPINSCSAHGFYIMIPIDLKEKGHFKFYSQWRKCFFCCRGMFHCSTTSWSVRKKLAEGLRGSTVSFWHNTCMVSPGSPLPLMHTLPTMQQFILSSCCYVSSRLSKAELSRPTSCQQDNHRSEIYWTKLHKHSDLEHCLCTSSEINEAVYVIVFSTLIYVHKACMGVWTMMTLPLSQTTPVNSFVWS